MASNESENRKGSNRSDDPSRNPDPITKAPGSHPIGTGVGAAAGGAAGIAGAAAVGAAAGSAVGPVGTAVGAAAGAVIGGLVGKGVAEQVNPTAENEYWESNYASRPYVNPGSTYDDYGPAYQCGWEARAQHGDKSFEEVDSDLSRDWDRRKGSSKLQWDQARPAARDAWERCEKNRPGT